jgi:hypothetical protein
MAARTARSTAWASATPAYTAHSRRSTARLPSSCSTPTSVRVYDAASPAVRRSGLDEGLARAIAAGNLGGAVPNAGVIETWPTDAKQQSAARAMVTGYLCAARLGATPPRSSRSTPPATPARAPFRATSPTVPTTSSSPATARPTRSRAATTRVATSYRQAPAQVSLRRGANNDSQCAMCHDFKGVVTGTSAWPHANRNIDVYEWIRPTGSLEVTPRSPPATTCGCTPATSPTVTHPVRSRHSRCGTACRVRQRHG